MVVPLIGYLDRFSARPGERLEVKVSSQLAVPYRADLVRVRHADPNPAGPGMKLIPVPADWAGEYPSVSKPVPRGSHGHAAGRLALGDAFSLLLRVAPWLPGEAPQVVLAIAGEARGLTLSVTSAGFAVEASQGGTTTRCATAAPPVRRHWYEIAVTLGGGRLTLAQRPLQPAWGAGDAGVAEAALPPADWSGEARISFAAAPDATAHFNGRIEDPLLLRGTPRVTLDDPDALLASGRVAAWWDLAADMEGEAILDRGPAALHGSLVNLPGRAVKGSRWTGAEHAWHHAPRHYAAVHFHADDLEDCRWATDFTVTIPDDLPSGVYAVRLVAGGALGHDPVLRAAAEGRGAGTDRLPCQYLHLPGLRQLPPSRIPRGPPRQAAILGGLRLVRQPRHRIRVVTYNAHVDGSGIHLSSRLRPIMTMRPGFVAVPDPQRLRPAAPARPIPT